MALGDILTLLRQQKLAESSTLSQSVDDATDVSPYNEVAVWAGAHGLGSASTATVKLRHALRNRASDYTTLTEFTFTGATPKLVNLSSIGNFVIVEVTSPAGGDIYPEVLASPKD